MKAEFLLQEVVKFPIALFFLCDDLLEHEPSCCVPALEGLLDDLPVEEDGVVLCLVAESHARGE